MAFTPISQSGYTVDFTSSAGVSLADSVIYASGVSAGDFQVTLPGRQSALFRVSALNYLLSGSATTPATFYTVDGGDSLETPNVGGLASFSPSPFVMESFIESGEANISYTGADNVTPRTETFAFLVEVWVDEAGEKCEEYGRVTRSYGSGFIRDRIHQSNLYPQETRCLVANFNAAIPPSRLIVSALWQTWNISNVILSMPKIPEGQREATVLMQTQVPGPAVVKCTVTLDNGEVYVQNFRINVLCAPIYQGTTWVTGPESVLVTVP
jgi:hypothetical protein